MTKRLGRWGISVATACLVWAVAVTGVAAAAENTVVSEEGLFEVSYRSKVTPVPMNRIHSWVLTVRRADGTPVTGAEIGIGGGMPMHGHGLPTNPRVTRELGEGEYLVEGMKFQMPGEWVVDVLIRTAQGEDRARFTFTILAGKNREPPRNRTAALSEPRIPGVFSGP